MSPAASCRSAIWVAAARAQPRRRIHDIAGNDPLTLLRPRTERDHSLSRVDPHPDLEREAGVLSVQLLDRLEDAEPRPHGPLRIVFMRHRSPEHRHHRITHELLHGAAEALDHVP